MHIMLDTMIMTKIPVILAAIKDNTTCVTSLLIFLFETWSISNAAKENVKILYTNIDAYVALLRPLLPPKGKSRSVALITAIIHVIKLVKLISKT